MSRISRALIVSFIADAKSHNAVAALAWILVVASPALAQGPLPIPSGPSAILPLGPPSITVHPRPRIYRPCTRWYVVHHRPLLNPYVVQYFRVPFPDECPAPAR
jgi:hypothetical protein